jgi:hypothetical protein
MRWMLSVARANNFYAGPFRLKRHRTKRGYHVELLAHIRLTSSRMVALQAILGSDYRREAFNLFRAQALPFAPAFWGRLPHWNVLHRGALQCQEQSSKTV